MDQRNGFSRSYARLPAAAVMLGVLLLGGPGLGAAAEELRIGGTGSALGTMRLLGQAFTKRNPDVTFTIVPNLGSGGGIKALVGGALDLALISRPMNDDERKLGLTETFYGCTPFVFAVSAKLKVNEITRPQLADIYAGKTQNWPDGTPIRLVLRPVSDIDTQMIKNLSPEIGRALSAAEQRPGVAFAVTDQDAGAEIERLPGAIGPTSIAVISSEKFSIKPLKLDGVEPTLKNLASGAYPYQKRMFFVAGVKQSAAAQRFVAFVQSRNGQQILVQTGHVLP